MKRRWVIVALAAVICLLAVLLVAQAPGIAAGALLNPARTRATISTPAGCDSVRFAGEGVSLAGWRCAAETAQRRGTIVYLHGIADNRASGQGVIRRYRGRGFDAVAYDSRAHGESDGDFCSYGFFEKRDLRRVLDTLAPGPVVLIGTSLGAAVALQGAADDGRVSGIVAAEVFSDLRTVARERAPFFLPDVLLAQAFRVAEQRGGFSVDAVRPAEAATRVRVPVLLIHGAEDEETRPAHSQRVHDALAGPKRLILVDGAGHNHSLSGPDVWVEIDTWIEDLARN